MKLGIDGCVIELINFFLASLETGMGDSESDSGSDNRQSFHSDSHLSEVDDQELVECRYNSHSESESDTEDELEEVLAGQDAETQRMEVILRQLGVRSNQGIPELTHDDLYQVLRYLNRKYLSEMEPYQTQRWGFQVFGIPFGDSNQLTVDDITLRFDQLYLQLLRLKFLLIDQDIIYRSNENYPEVDIPSVFVARIQEVLVNMRDALITGITMSAIKKNNTGVYATREIRLFRFSQIDYSENTHYQNLLLYLLSNVRKLNYVRQDHKFLKEISSDGIDGNVSYGTRAYEEACTITTFVSKCVRKEYIFSQWQNMTHSIGNQKAAVEYLMTSCDVEVPTYNPSRHLHSFMNGIYITKTHQFIPYDEMEKLPVEYENFHSCHFKPLKFWPEVWIDQLGDIDNFPRIQTPDFDRLMEHQDWPVEVQYWFYAMCGKMGYEVNELDRWQIQPFLRGVAQSGKSTILKYIATTLFKYDDVAVLGNDMEKQFGLSILAEEYKRMMYYCTEVREDFKLPQAQFQSMVTGEPINMAVKFKTARTTVIKCPGMLAGNVHMQYVDTSRSVARRILEFYFGNCVHDLDTELPDKLEKESAAFLVKCNLAYQSKVRRHGSKAIWEAVPQYFHDLRKLLEQDLNPFCCFLETSLDIQINPGLYMPYKDLKKMYNDWLDTHNIPRNKMRLTQDYLKVIFDSKSLCLKVEERVYNGVMNKIDYVLGIDQTANPGSISSTLIRNDMGSTTTAPSNVLGGPAIAPAPSRLDMTTADYA